MTGARNRRARRPRGLGPGRRSYDSEELSPLRLQSSGIRERKGLWEIRHDPYDISRIHVRGPDGWITVFWKHLDRAPLPFGELAWDHARRSLGREASEEQIADAVRRCCAARTPAPRSRRSRRWASGTAGWPRGRTAGPAGDQQGQPGPHVPAGRPAPPAAAEDEPLAKVIPMKIFDPFAEADKRW